MQGRLYVALARRSLLADAETPVSAYLKLAPAGACCLLESAELAGHAGRYSFLGASPKVYLVADHGQTRLLVRQGEGSPTLQAAPMPEAGAGSWQEIRLPEASPLRALQHLFQQARVCTLAAGRIIPGASALDGGLEGVPPLPAGAVGYFSYDLVRHLERLPNPPPDRLQLPEAVFVLPEVMVVFDHLRHSVLLNALDVQWLPAPGTGPLDADPVRRLALEKQLHQRLDEVAALLQQQAPLAATAPLAAAASPACGRQESQQQCAAQQPNTARPQGTAGPDSGAPEQEDYCRAVQRAKEYIRAGDIFQVVLSRRLSLPLTVEPFSVYRALRSLNPSPYLYYLDFGPWQLIGSSPETLVRLQDGLICTRPIAGTRRRGRDAAEDVRLAAELLADEKERAEHVMLVDLARNDVGRVARPGTVRVPEFMQIESYSDVMHLVSTVEGRLRPGMDAFDLLAACFPAGTVSGAPKVRAMEIIDELEPAARGPYAGAVGYFSFSGPMDMAITIRTLVAAGGKVHIQAGAGIVADSLPEREWMECQNKARALMRALDWARQWPQEAQQAETRRNSQAGEAGDRVALAGQL